jgi:hypothetical protein
LLLLVFFTVNVSLFAIQRRDRSPIDTFRAPVAVPVAGAVTCLALMPFVPLGSLLTAGIVISLGVALVALRRRVPPA